MLRHFALDTAVAVDNTNRVVVLGNEISVGLLRGVSFYLDTIAGGATQLTFYVHARDSVNNTHGAAPGATHGKASHALTVALDIDATDPTAAVVHVSDFQELYLVPHPDFDTNGELHVVLDAGTANLRVRGAVEV